MPTQEETLIRIGAAAAVLGIGSSAVRRACDNGRLPYWLSPGSHQRRLKLEDVLAYKEHGYVLAQARQQP